MRRFIAYSLLAATMLAAVGVSAQPVFTEMNSGREFNNGYEITFKVESNEENTTLDKNAAEVVATEMRHRLDNFNFEDYSVKVEKGYDKNSTDVNSTNSQYVTVSLCCEQKLFNNVCRYLTFSGTKFALSKNDDEEEQVKEDIFNYNDVYVDQMNDLVPIVIIPLTEQGKTDLENLLENTSSESEGEEENTTSNADIYLWGNYEDGDNATSAQENPYISSKIICSFSSQNIWYTKEDGASDDYVEHSCIKIICGSMTESEENPTYDFSKLKDANNMATYYVNMFKASKYDYKVSCPSASAIPGAGLDFITNATKTNPSNENLLDYTNNVRLAPSTTLLTTLIAIAIIVICFGLFYRLFSISLIATTISSLFLTVLAVIKMGVLFNIPLLIGVLIVAAGSLASEIIYLNKLKEEVYKGRTLKKANQEASKKTNLFTLDVAVVSMIAGLMTYILGGSALKPMGVCVFFGSLIVLLMNLIVFKFLMYLLCNSTDLQERYSLFNLNKKYVPNLMLEQKPTYVAPLENVNFTSKKKIGGIVLGALSLLGLVGILVFGIKDGSPLNVSSAMKETTVIYTSLKADDSTIENMESFKQYVLKDIQCDSVEKKDVDIFDEDEKDTICTSYYVCKINKEYSSNEIFELKRQVCENIEDLSISQEKYDVSVLTVKELVYTPDQGLVALATGISIAVVAIYFVLRFKPSRGLAVLATTTATIVISYGLISLTRIGTTAITSVAMPAVAIVSLLASLFYLSIEKTMLKENRDELTKEKLNEITVKSLGKAALPTLVFLAVMVFLSINYFGFGLKTTTFLFASMLIGEVIGSISLFMVTGPLANLISGWLSKIRMPKIKFNKKKDTVVEQKQKTSEPEETTFIGIND